MTHKLPEDLRNQFLRVYLGTADRVNDVKDFALKLRGKIGINPFMAALKRYDQKRWQLAVKRFVSYLDKKQAA